jgi:hypothetical protein
LPTRLVLLVLAVVLAPGAAAAPRATGPLVALSLKDGSVQDFPRVSGTAVYAIVDDGHGGWFVGGKFATIGGVACRNLAHVRSDRSVDRGWCPRPDGTVRALARSATVLYVGGLGISRIGGARRSALAALGTGTGRVTPWNPGPASRIGDVLQLTVDAARRQLLVTGEFSRLGGAAREWLAGVGLGTARATRFTPAPDATSHGDSVVGTVAAAGSIYAWGFFSEIGGLPRDAFARLHPVTGRALPTVVSPICPTALLAAGRRLYAGTDPSCAGVKRPLIALGLPALEPITWHPVVPRRHVEALAAAQRLVVVAAANDHFSTVEPRLVVGLDASGHRAFTSPVHPAGIVQALAAGSGLVLVGVSR